MLGSNLLDAIPCYVNAENIANCNKSRIYQCFRPWDKLVVIVEYLKYWV